MKENRFDDDKMLEKIRQSAEKVEIPDSLNPDNLEEKLKDQGRGQRVKRKKSGAVRRTIVRFAELAAILVLVAAVGYQVGERNLAGEAVTKESVTAEGETSAEKQETEETEEPVLEGAFRAQSTTDLFQRLQDYVGQQKNNGANYAGNNGGAVLYQEAAIGAVASADTGASSGTGGFSQTNLREAGVDEGDVVKTDGSHLYILKPTGSVEIIKASGTKMEQVSSVRTEDLSETVEDMYLDGDRLILISSGTESNMSQQQEDVYQVESRTYTRVTVYDITDRSRPVIFGSTEQEGYYRSSRKTEDYLYLFTEYQPTLGTTEEDSRVLPLVNGMAMEAENIFLPECMETTTYLVMGSVDVKKPHEAVDTKAVVSGAGSFYVSGSNIYICSTDRNQDRTFTRILKFSYLDGKIRGEAAGEVEGYLNDTFSLDEYQGYLRAVTTSWADSGEINSLSVLDQDLKVTGKITDIAPGETIRSARFMGDTGYFVTFRQTDPLFSVDLSDPENPRILGELKVTGFSSYLHYYGDDMLLGIGYEADADTGATTGVKLSMFDISDPAKVKEVKKYVVKDAQYCPGVDNYKAIMIDPEKNLFGFVCDGEYLVFSYQEGGFENLLTYTMDSGQDQYWYQYESLRGSYIGETFYLADSQAVLAFDMKNDFQLEEKMEL